ncbi:AAA family ATPase [Citrobacter amalonaticus]|uniref:AAA family ATPase n=1 Tax=Citrobacter amalonaticus TaxID=35703 RepID=UPI0019046861|nr:ATP-binding protein [Citrobacter amalonaticus]MBJ9256025.1 AAA family ATPase [Citrobacter amalonaticus]
MRQPYRIESVTLKGIGVFEHTYIEFPPIKREERDVEKAEIHIFTGPNGCGKSTMLYALAGIFSFDLTNISLLTKRFKDTSSKVAYRFAGGKGSISVATLEPKKVSVSFSSHQVLTDYRQFTQQLTYPLSGSTPFAAFAYSGQRANRDSLYVKDIEEITDSPFDDALSFENTIRPRLIAKWVANTFAKAALARAENAEEEASDYERSLERITLFINDVCDEKVEFRLNRKTFSVDVMVEGELLKFDILPDGMKSIITWIADLALRLENTPWLESRDIFAQPIILFLDEVDIHLHPKWQRRILPAIQKLLPNAQVFVSTHSPFVVGSVEDAWVYRLPEHKNNVCRDTMVPETINAIPSKAGKSYQLILAEVFGVDEEFDVETQQQLTAFKNGINEHMHGHLDRASVMSLAQTLSDKGEELANIVSLELRQMHRLMSKTQG